MFYLSVCFDLIPVMLSTCFIRFFGSTYFEVPGVCKKSHNFQSAQYGI